MGPRRYVGVDLAWGTRSPTGLAVLDETGVLLDVATLRADDDIVAWLEPHTEGPCVVAIDAPLVVTNPTGRRRCEAELSAVFGPYDAGTHPTSRSRPEFAEGSRGGRLAARLGLSLDPVGPPRRALEVYPHAATVVLFGLDRTLKYKHKPGRDLDLLRGELQRLLDHVGALAVADPPMATAGSTQWAQVRRAVAGAATKSALRAVEDAVDAVVCAYVAMLADRHPDRMTVFGDPASGCIVTPTLPVDHPGPAARPPRRRGPVADGPG